MRESESERVSECEKGDRNAEVRNRTIRNENKKRKKKEKSA